MKRATNLTELATIAGVSVGTVSKALSNRGYVSALTRERILMLANKHGFQINRTAQSLKRGRNDAVAVTLPLGHESAQTFSDPFFITLIGHLADALSARGTELVLSKIIPKGPGWLSNIARGGRVDGIIVIGQSDQEDELRAVASHYLPLVVWGQQTSGQTYCSVGSDNFAGGLLAVRHLTMRGRKRIAFLGMNTMPEISARHAGFIQGCREAGIASDLYLDVHMTAAAAYDSTVAALEHGFVADGIVAASDVIAISAMRALSERGLRVPEDIAIVGYDDVGMSAFTSPPLTTIRQDLAGAAEQMVDKLSRRMQGEETPSLSIDPTLVERASG